MLTCDRLISEPVLKGTYAGCVCPKVKDLAIDHAVCCVSVEPMHEARDGGPDRRSRSGSPLRAEWMGSTDRQQNKVINRSSTTLIHTYKHFNCQFTSEGATN